MKPQRKINPWVWIPSLYFVEGLPNVAVVSMSVILYKNLGMSNADIAFYTGLLYWPWVIKPVWSPFIDLIRNKRWWIVAMQLLLGAGLIGIAFGIPTRFYVRFTLAFFWLVAFSSATHDIAADGFYLLGLNDKQQSFFVGIRSVFYKAATIFGSGALVYLAGKLSKSTENVPYAWSITFLIMGGLILLFGLYHQRQLPHPEQDVPQKQMQAKEVWYQFLLTFAAFFKKKHVIRAIFFLLTFRFAEAQLLKLIQPFLLDAREAGGLGLSTEDVGLIYGVYGVIGLTLGGLLGGFAAVRGGLKRWLWPMLLSMLLTCIVFVYLAYYQTDNWFVINLCVVVEQFGYGFGFTAYMLFMMQFSKGEYPSAHYAICTGIMAAGMMLPGMFAGKIEERLGGYLPFFIYVMICSIVPVISAILLKIDDDSPQSISAH
ncbi:MAG: MFS transporter [Dysgonamonadaceae bacterium]|jgi:PAT family beta-lactamase induction signal transducer AmpG|nr:MFS transporter [Dysgonamonadaceae bacterium]